MTYATTFSGIAGWELGLNACGWELKWQCENNEWCRRLLAERFGVPIYRDIRTICDESPPPVDALIGSPPCQPFSVAGAQGGTADERHLYPVFIKLVAQIQPRWVLMEQVPAILSIDGGRAFAGYIGGLVALGYDVCWHCIPACAVGANHQRDRIWIVAHSTASQLQGAGRRNQRAGRPAVRLGLLGSNVANPDRQRHDDNGRQGEAIQGGDEPENGILGANGALVSDTQRERQPGQGKRSKRGGDEAKGKGQTNNAFSIRLDGQWAVEPNVGRVANGIPSRVDRLKGLGNAVVPQIPYLIGQAINQTLSQPLNQSEK